MHAAPDRLTRASISCAHFPMRHKFEEEEEDFQISCVHQIVRWRESWVSIQLPSKMPPKIPLKKSQTKCCKKWRFTVVHFWWDFG